MTTLNPSVGNARAGVGDNVYQVPRSGKTGETSFSRALGEYAEAVMRGNVWCAQVGVAGVAPGIAISTTPPLALWNPPNSGKLVVVYKFLFAYASGTLGAGEMIYLQNAQTTAPTTGTAITPVNCLIGNGNRSTASAFTGSTVAATPTFVKSTGIFFGAFVGGASAPMATLMDQLDGEIVIYPGNVLSVQDNVNNAGTSPKVDLGFIYEEVPIT